VQGKNGNCQERNSIITEYNHCLDYNQAILLKSNFKFWGNIMAQPSILQVLKSVLSAFIGIQSKENREQDFTQGKASHYIVIGVVVTILFIISLIVLVSKVIGS
jgi:hypothetical protein